MDVGRTGRLRSALPSLLLSTASFAVLLSWAIPRGLAGHQPLERVAAWLVIIAIPALAVWLWRRQLRRQRADEKRQQAQRRLLAVVRTGDELLWEMDSHGVITYLAPIVKAYLGYAPQELTGRHLDVVLPAGERVRARQLLSTSATQASGWTDEYYTFVTKDGRERAFMSSGITHVGAGGRVVGFTGTMRRLDGDAAEQRRLELARDRVSDVLERRTLRTVFQPIIDVATGEVIGAEALSRFPVEPALTPDRWFADAAAAGLGAELELLAVETALEAARQLPPHVYVSVNLSPATLRSGQVTGLLGSSAWPSTRLVIEITEHMSVEDYEPLAACVEELRRRGPRLAVDDAGAGYASFRHILRLAPDYIKLDRGLIAGMDADPARRALVSAVVTFAREVGAAVIAEGIETSEELHAVRMLGIQSAQGYFIGRPSPAEPGWGTRGA